MASKEELSLIQVRAIGNFLSTYQTDLNYIQLFQEFKRGGIAKRDYLEKEKGSFYSFLIEFRIMRNIEKARKQKLLHESIRWIGGPSPDNVNKFAERLKASGITHGDLTISLASKILFLNNPMKIMPYDRRAKETLGYSGKDYEVFAQYVESYRKEKSHLLSSSLNTAQPLITLIEKSFHGKLESIEKIRINRFVDKLLWTNADKPE